MTWAKQRALVKNNGPCFAPTFIELLRLFYFGFFTFLVDARQSLSKSFSRSDLMLVRADLS